VDRQNIVMECRWDDEKYDQLPDLAAETELAIAEQQGFRFWATMAKLPTSVPHFPNGS
jgi:hypothetical protein